MTIQETMPAESQAESNGDVAMCDPRPSKPGRRGKLTAALVVVASLAAVAATFAAVPKTKPTPPIQPPPPVEVSVWTVQPVENFADVLRIDGEIRPNVVVNVGAEVAGQIEAYAGSEDAAPGEGKRHVFPADRKGKTLDEGMVVKQGQPLVYLEDTKVASDVESATAQSQSDQADLQRMQDVLSRGAATSMEMDRVRARASVSSAFLNSALVQMKYTTIRAPISGVLNRLPVEVGEYVRPGDPVAQIVDLERMKVCIDVPESDASYLRAGQQAFIRTGDGPDQTITGKVTYVGEVADALTRTTPVEITADNPADAGKRALRSGQFVTVELVRRQLGGELFIPLAAVIPLESGRAVYIVRDDKAVEMPIELGIIRGARVQIVKGLSAGDQLIVQGQRFVSTGQAVSIIQQMADPLAGPLGQPLSAPAVSPATAPADVAADSVSVPGQGSGQAR